MFEHSFECPCIIGMKPVNFNGFLFLREIFYIFVIMKLYLDDIRNPKTDGWTIVRSYDEFVDFIKIHGLPEMMSLDHDLGAIRDGYDCVKWLVEKQLDLREVEINVHSANPVGKDNMEKLIENWNNWLDKEK